MTRTRTRRRPSAAPWGSRIVRTGVLPACEFLANPRNWRVHPRAQQQALGGILHEVGFVQGVLVNLRTAPAWGRNRRVETLIDGHARVELALSRGEDTPVPVTYVDLDPREERRVLALFDTIGAMAGRDEEKLDGLAEETLRDYPGSEVDLSAVLRRERRHVAFEAGTATNVLVTCADADQQARLIERLVAEGYGAKATTRR